MKWRVRLNGEPISRENADDYSFEMDYRLVFKPTPISTGNSIIRRGAFITSRILGFSRLP